MRDFAVGPSASSSATHPRPMPHENRAGGGIHPLPQAKRRELQTTPPGIISRNSHETTGPHDDGFQVAQIKPAVLDHVHRALRGKQTVLAQIPLRPASQAANARYFRNALFNQCLPPSTLRKTRLANTKRKPEQAPHTPPRNASQIAESSTNAALCDTSREENHAGIAATITGQMRIHAHPTVTAMES